MVKTDKIYDYEGEKKYLNTLMENAEIFAEKYLK